MRNWLAALIAGPDGAVDEAALFIALLAVTTFLSFVVLNSLVIFMVLWRHQAFQPMDFATATATLLASAGTVSGLVTGFIGYRNSKTCTTTPSAASPP